MITGHFSIIKGDALASLAKMPAASVQCVVTSPPYYGLRDYGVTGQIGQETTPDEYIRKLVDVFRECRRVLRDDGTFWLNIGDRYAGSKLPGLKPKDRIMVPARLALALQADGWWLRDEIVWHKPRATPNGVKDRTCPAHEMLYLLTKSERYYFDYLAIEEPAIYAGLVRKRGKAFRTHGKAKAALLANARKVDVGNSAANASDTITVRETRRKRSVWSINPQPYRGSHFATCPPALVETCVLAGSRPGDIVMNPFGGSGTVGLVACRNGRNALLIELNPDYVGMAWDRIVASGGLPL